MAAELGVQHFLLFAHSEKPDRRSGQSGKEQRELQGARSAGSLGVKFDKVEAQLPSLSAKTKVFVVLRAPLQRFEDRSIKLLFGVDPGRLVSCYLGKTWSVSS
jgi:hypothetical protein